MTALFQPIGEKSRADMLTDALAEADYGTEYTFDELATFAGLETGDVANVQSVVNAAKRRLTERHRRAVESVRGKGYRIVEPEEQLRLSKKHTTKSRRQLVKARTNVAHADLHGLADEVRAQFTRQESKINYLLESQRRISKRQDNLDKLIEETTGRVDELQTVQATSLDEIRARLEKLEQPRTHSVLDR